MPKESILAIDDEKDILKLLQYNLEKEGYRVWTAESGEKGFEIAKAKKPELILLDLMLPQIDGLEVCRLLKSHSSTQQIPVLMLSAKDSEVDQVVGFELGATDYLIKPFSVKVLLARIKNIFRKKNASHEETKTEVLVSGGFVLDQEKMLFTLKGKEIVLTKTEFNILSVLLKRAGGVVKREQLIASVWGVGAVVSQAAINMQIKSLRKKLGKQRNFVETVRGFGYRFLEE